MENLPVPSLGRVLGWLAVVIGAFYLALGVANLWKGQRLEAFDGLLFGGLAVVAGCVILFRRKRMTKSTQNESAQPEPDTKGLQD